MEFKFCPFCGKELNAAFAFCPYCGADIAQFTNNNSNTAAPTQAEDDISSDKKVDILTDLFKKEQALHMEYSRKLARARVLCIRGEYDDAQSIYEDYINAYPDFSSGYAGYVRVASKNFTLLEGDEVDSAISMLHAVCPKLSELADDELLDYLARRELRDCVIEDGVLVKYNGSAEHLTVPDRFVSKIGSSAFSGNATLVSVVLSEGITVIERSAFEECKNLEKIELTGVTRIGAKAFERCKNLKTVKLGENIREIGYSAFLDAGKFAARIFIPSSIKIIENAAFNGNFDVYLPFSREYVEENFSSTWYKYSEQLNFDAIRADAE